MENKNIKASFFKSIKSQNNTITTLELVFKDIKNGKWKNEIEQIRLAKATNRDEVYSKLKTNLHCFTPSAIFKDKRDKNLVLIYSGIMSIDYDGLLMEEVDEIKNIIISNPNTYGCFISPSGNGLKVFVKIDSNKESHLIAFNQIRNYYDALVGIESDKSCKDVGRLCFVSYDKALYINLNSETFSIKEIFICNSKSDSATIHSHNAIIKGARNNYLTSVAGTLVSRGLSQKTILSALLEENNEKCSPKLSDEEVRGIVNSITKYESEDPIIPVFKKLKPLENDFYKLLPSNVLTEFIDIVSPHSESSIMGLIFSFITSLGNILGKKMYHKVEGDKHYGNLFICLVGGTSTGRKGTSWGRVRGLFNLIDPDWVNSNIKGGLYNGVGLIHSVRDEKKIYSKKAKGEITVDKGVKDKRLLAVQTEFVSVLSLSKGESNIITQVLRDAWDGGNLTTLIKNNRDISTNPHISIIGHITPNELLDNIAKSDLSNGFANRFLWVFVEMTKELPFGGDLKDSDLMSIVVKVKSIIEWVNDQKEIEMIWDEGAKQTWRDSYSDLVQDFEGDLGTVTSRAAPQVLRLTMLFAVMEKDNVMKKEHLKAALTLWKYALKSADFIFGNNMNGKTQNKILLGLTTNHNGLTKTQIHKLFNNHVSKEDINTSLSYLSQFEWIYKQTIPTNGKNKTIYFLELNNEKKEN
tara:strand:- start:964 stop:3045 length:2082 start_codon:yes stop_codon:yes gene_type:complete